MLPAMTHPSRLWQALTLALLVSPVGPVQAESSYDPTSNAWDGLKQFVERARALELDVATPTTLDYGQLQATRQLLAVIYPLVPLKTGPLLAYLQRGGRVLLADDFGRSREFLQQLGIEVETHPVEGGLFFRNQEQLPVAAPTDERHLLVQGVPRLVTNHPATLRTKLPAVFVVGAPPRTVVTLGAVGSGRLAMVSDPSIFINNMMEIPGNAQFAENLLRYLATGERPQLVMVARRFGQGDSNEDDRPPAAAAGASQRLRKQLRLVAARFGPAREARTPPRWRWALSVAGLVFLLVALVLQLGPRPRRRRGSWLQTPEQAAKSRTGGANDG
jgi:hypothetical protein